jgi:rare lipoprotein A
MGVFPGGNGVRPGICVISAIALASAAALCGSAQAQSLSDAASASLVQNAPAENPIGTWQTAVTTETVVQGSDPGWTASSIKAPPSRLASVAASPATRPQGLGAPRGPRLTGAGHGLTGLASYYGKGETTATGERFDPTAMTAAHRTLPFGTRVRVTRVDTGNSVVVRINDRGPFKPDRVIDLSEGAAENLGMTSVGLTPVRLEVLGH